MKTRILAIFLLSLLAFTPALAQQDETVVVKKSDLTADQLKKLETQNITNQLGTYKEWAEIGKGVGYAVKESLSAVKDTAVDFSKTDVGKYTMFLVAWKIMAKDVISVGDMFVGYLVGIPLLTVGLCVLVWSYRRQCVVRRVVTEEGPGFWIWRSRKYEVYDPANRENSMDQSDLIGIHAVAAVVLIAICCLMMFANLQ